MNTPAPPAHLTPHASRLTKKNTLDTWLQWQQGLHPQAVDLGLERVCEVLARLQLSEPPYSIITVAGTNGKGSTVAMLEAILDADGYRVGAYTSPHLLRYNERIRVGRVEADDAALCEAFAKVDTAREATTLSFFEFGTLAALQHFADTAIDIAILEVGLGGRLDAVNAVDADAAIVTTIGIDHVDWLGPDRESIGYEKAGVYRPGKPAICADSAPPQSLLDHAAAIGATLYQVGVDYAYEQSGTGWSWWCDDMRYSELPLPTLVGEHQLNNAAAAIMALTTLATRIPLTEKAIHIGLRQAHLPGRLQIIPGPVEWIVDVSHNPQGAEALARFLRQRDCSGRTLAVLALFKDKDITGIIRALSGIIDAWYCAGLSGARGLAEDELISALRSAKIPGIMETYSSVALACSAAMGEAVAGDRIVVFGSFVTVAAVLQSGLLEETNRG